MGREGLRYEKYLEEVLYKQKTKIKTPWFRFSKDFILFLNLWSSLW